MANTKPNGGPAFPVSEDAARGKVSGIYGGMTLRDYFAAQAMAGLTAIPSSGYTFEGAAEDAYKFADAMIAQRTK